MIKERNKRDKNNETWGGRNEGGERRLYDVQGVGKEYGKWREGDQSHGRNKNVWQVMCWHKYAQHISLRCAPREFYFSFFKGKNLLTTQT